MPRAKQIGPLAFLFLVLGCSSIIEEKLNKLPGTVPDGVDGGPATDSGLQPERDGGTILPGECLEAVDCPNGRECAANCVMGQCVSSIPPDFTTCGDKGELAVCFNGACEQTMVCAPGDPLGCVLSTGGTDADCEFSCFEIEPGVGLCVPANRIDEDRHNTLCAAPTAEFVPVCRDGTCEPRPRCAGLRDCGCFEVCESISNPPGGEQTCEPLERPRINGPCVDGAGRPGMCVLPPGTCTAL